MQATGGKNLMDLRKLRRERGITQVELANAAGISQAMLSNIENGNRKPSVETARRIAAKLGIDWYELFDGDKREGNPNE